MGYELRKREIVPTRVQMYSILKDHTVRDRHIPTLLPVPVICRMLHANFRKSRSDTIRVNRAPRCLRMAAEDAATLL